jgi:hypothetical protein
MYLIHQWFRLENGLFNDLELHFQGQKDASKLECPRRAVGVMRPSRQCGNVELCEVFEG